MIQANELRIGNWVYNPDPIDVFVKIKASDIEYLEQIEGDSSLGSYSCVPILLTPEVLEKAGFEEYYEDVLRLKLNEGLVDEIIFANGIISLATNQEYSEPTKLKYLHQLQNLYFALTQTELEIKLLANSQTGKKKEV